MTSRTADEPMHKLANVTAQKVHHGFPPLTSVQLTVTERAPGTWLNPGPAIVMPDALSTSN